MPAIRVNTIKISPQALVSALANRAINLSPLAESTTAFFTQSPTTDLTALPEYHEGLFYIQNLSSQMVAPILDPQPGEKILDLTAAPGSKTTHIAALMNNTGELVANDMSRTRMFKLKANLERYGVKNVKLETTPGEKLWMKYHEYFDRTLLDAPCSMQGTGHAEPVTNKEIKKLAKRQQWLLRSAVSATKPGGIIVYSTCTTTKEENEDVIDWIRAKDHNVTVEEMKRVAPDERHEGFFIARLRKKSDGE